MIRHSSCLMTIALTACTTTMTPIRWAPSEDFDLTVTDSPIAQRFDITLTSRAHTSLCLPRETWPTETAVLPAGFDNAILITSSGKKELLSTGSAYCPNGCGEIRIEPGQTLRGTLPYSAFEDAAAISSDSIRTLMIEVNPFICARQRDSL